MKDTKCGMLSSVVRGATSHHSSTIRFFLYSWQLILLIFCACVMQMYQENAPHSFILTFYTYFLHSKGIDVRIILDTLLI